MARKKQSAADAPISENSVERFDKEVQPILDTLTTPEKIRFLKECIIDYEYQVIDNSIQLLMEADYSDSYHKKCKRALKKYEQLSALEEEQEALTTSRNPDFTTARQVLAVHYLLRAAGMRLDSVDKTSVARLIEFLTGKNYRNIYDCVRQPLKLSDKEAEKDLKYIKPYFEKLGLTRIAEMIEKE